MSSCWCSAELWKGVPTQASSSSSDRGFQLQGPSQNIPHVASKRDVNVTKLILAIFATTNIIFNESSSGWVFLVIWSLLVKLAGKLKAREVGKIHAFAYEFDNPTNFKPGDEVIGDSFQPFLLQVWHWLSHMPRHCENTLRGIVKCCANSTTTATIAVRQVKSFEVGRERAMLRDEDNILCNPISGCYTRRVFLGIGPRIHDNKITRSDMV
ncbi:hypothetical protein AVEN_80548-1 [Araneus ventricosus]|uniref:Uncharacterized protein n=1 Tax=Araneus ventricosus TaxID=182803 RepID=A0A4Y2CNF0_ARAVE|nr:hypothetical protein AVEN_80548-1 [Araneus ventricosus]